VILIFGFLLVKIPFHPWVKKPHFLPIPIFYKVLLTILYCRHMSKLVFLHWQICFICPHLQFLNIMWCTPKLLERFKCKSQNENGRRRNYGMLLRLQHFESKRGMLELRDGDWDEWKMDQLFIWICTNQTTSWLMHSWSTFGAQMNHEHTQTHKSHKTCHSLDLGEATIFPLIIFFVICHGGCTQMSFFLGLTN